jgi:hypothetical protein
MAWRLDTNEIVVKTFGELQNLKLEGNGEDKNSHRKGLIKYS